MSISLKRFFNMATNRNDRGVTVGICIVLVAVVWIVFGRTLGYGFLIFDDNKYVSENPIVQKGLTGEGIRWALTFGDVGHWHPVTWFSHMLDCQLYGLHAWGHHFTNILLHCAAVVLLFLLLRSMTGSLWRSACVAAVFAIHPLRAESVSWVSERKDVLSAVFFMLTLWGYVRYTRGPFSMVRYGVVVLFYALGLLSKDMLVTMPFVLLLLDYWPLGRLSGQGRGRALRLAAEKIPLLALAAGSCAATLLASEKISSDCRMLFDLRLENAIESYVIYLRQMVWPSGLACVYPNPVHGLPLWQVAGAMALLLTITAAAVAARRRQPTILVGWLWYLGMLVPVIGIVQISYYAHADRYTYLPSIGVLIIVAWGLKAIAGKIGNGAKVMVKIASVAAISILCRTAWKQVGFWENNNTLFSHAIAVTKDNYIAYNHLSYFYEKVGRKNDAIACYRKSLDFHPDQDDTHNRLGILLSKSGRIDEAFAHIRKALEISPGNGFAHYNMGILLAKTGHADDAMTHYLKALEINPADNAIYNNMGILLAQTGRMDEAIVNFRKALELRPAGIEALQNLVFALEQKGRWEDASSVVRNALAYVKSTRNEDGAETIARILAGVNEAANSSQVNSPANAQR